MSLNIKIVYNKRVHKLSSSITTYEGIKEATKKIYPNKLKDDLQMFV